LPIGAERNPDDDRMRPEGEAFLTRRRDRFLVSRGLRSWNASDEPWEHRGYEQAAEVLAWGLGERIITPSIPDNDFEQLCDAFEFLTGVAPPPGGWIVS